MRFRVGQIILVVILLATPAWAYRREYAVTLDGSRKAGSEVCFYRGDSAADPFTLFFSYDKVKCLPADQVLDLPAGLFHVFARHRDGYVSAHRDFFVHNAPTIGESGYEMLEIPLEKAAYADMSLIRERLKTGQNAGVWLAPTVNAQGAYFPLVDDESTIMVPAGRPFVPLLVANKVPIAVGSEMFLRQGESKTVAAFSRDRLAAVVAWVKLDRADLDSMDPNRLQLPQITLVSGEERRTPLFPIMTTPSTHTLVIFNDVPPGPAQVEVRGKTWVHYEREIVVEAATVTVERAPLLLSPAAALELSWNLGTDLPDAASCTTDKIARPPFTLRLSQCNTVDGERRCRLTARREQKFVGSGVTNFEGILPGTYTVTVDAPVSKPFDFDVTLPVGVVTSVPIPFTPFSFFGTVTLNDEPLQARLFFETGEAVADAAGRYTATLASDPRKNLISIYRCSDGVTFTYTPDRGIVANTAYDIDLAVRPLEVTVVDPTGLVPVPNAFVTFSPVKESGGGSYYASAPLETDERGRVKFPSVPADKYLVICGRHSSYARRCGEPLSPKALAAGKATLQFKASMLQGRVLGHVGYGTLTLVDPFGRITEEVTLRADGTFSLEQVHTPREHAVYVSDKRALTVVPLPHDLTGLKELILTLPVAPVRSFTVTVTGMKSADGFVGIWVDGRYVPLQALTVHQDMRGRDVMIARGGTVTFMDIAETGPILIAFVPVIPAAGDFIDPFTLPQYASVERVRVTTQNIALQARE